MVSVLSYLPLTQSNKDSGKPLSCTIHTCPHRCHQLQDHSKMQCNVIVSSTCSKGHSIKRKCYNKAAASCQKCAADAVAEKKRRERDHKLDQERQKNQQAYAARLVEIEDEIEHQKRQLGDRVKEQDRQNALAQKKQDLLNLQQKVRDTVQVMTPPESIQLSAEASQQPITSTPRIATPCSTKSETSADDASARQSEGQSNWANSEAKDDWKEQKELWGAENEALDTLMSMIGKFVVRSRQSLLTLRRSRVCQRAVPCYQKQG
jgi:hypothetical protein